MTLRPTYIRISCSENDDSKQVASAKPTILDRYSYVLGLYFGPHSMLVLITFFNLLRFSHLAGLTCTSETPANDDPSRSTVALIYDRTCPNG